MILYLFLDIVNLTSIRGFDFNLDLIILLKTTGLVFIIFSVMYSTVNKLPFALTFGATRKISETNIAYCNIYKTVPLAIISPTVLENFSFKVKNTNPKRL